MEEQHQQIPNRTIMNILQIAGLIGCFVVALILLRGLWNMMKGGSGNTSQKLMRLRVAAQAIVVLILVAVVYLSR